MLLVALACSSPAPPGVEPSRPPDILVVVLDTLRKDAVGAYGADRPVTPTFDALAERGVLFTDATSAGSWTWPSHASLFTGQPPWVHGAHFLLPEGQDYEERLSFSQPSEELPMLAERLAAAGYRTGAFVGNPMLNAELGMMRGFETVEVRRRDSGVVTAAEAWLEQDDEAPRLMFVNLFGAHAPWDIQPVVWLNDRPELQPGTAPAWIAPYLGEGKVDLLTYLNGPSGLIRALRGELDIPPEGLELIRDLYDGEVLAVERQLSRLVGAWVAEVGTGSVIAVTSDHGELLGEDGLFEHGRHVRPELVEAPLVLVAPTLEPRVEASPVHVHQLHDTLLFMAGLSEDPGLLGPSSGIVQARAWPEQIWVSQVGAPFDQGWSLYREGGRGVVFGDRTGGWCWPDGEPLESCAEILDRGRASFPERAAQGAEVRASGGVSEQLRALGYVE